MKVKELQSLSVEDLFAKEREMSESLFRLKFQHSVRPLDNTAKLSLLKKDVARVKTIITEKRKASIEGKHNQ